MKTMSKLHDAATNALNIAREMPNKNGLDWLAENDVTTDQQSRCVEAAVMLAQIEAEPSFEWEQQRNDYETTCARIGQLVASKRAISPTRILAALN